MSLAMLVGTVIALLLLGVPLWTGLVPLHAFGGAPPLDPRARRVRLWLGRRLGGDLCTLAGVLGCVCTLSARGLLGGTATLAVFLGLFQAGLGLAYLRAQRVKRASALVFGGPARRG